MLNLLVINIGEGANVIKRGEGANNTLEKDYAQALFMHMEKFWSLLVGMWVNALPTKHQLQESKIPM